MKVAVLGGSFDPVTFGHLYISAILKNMPQIDEVWLMPCFTHNFGKNMTDFKLRFNMCVEAVKNINGLKVSDYEYKSRDIKGTYNIITRLKNEFQQYKIHLVMGMDNALGINKWDNYSKLIKEIPCIVLPRQGYRNNNKNVWFLSEPHLFLDVVIPRISSSYIRMNINKWNDEEIQYYLPGPVYSIIKEEELYEKDCRRQVIKG